MDLSEHRRRRRTRDPRALAAIVAGASIAMLLGAGVASSAPDGTEGSSYAGQTVGAPAGCNAQSNPTIDWGEGGAETAATCADFSHIATGSHTYAEEGTYAAVAHYVSTNGPRTTSFAPVIADAAVTASGRSLAASVGVAFHGVVAHVSDADPGGVAGDYAATVEWGDGSSSAAVAQPASEGFDIVASHTYSAPGSAAVTATINDSGGAGASAHSTAIVAASAPGAAPPASAPSAAFAIVPGALGHISFDASASRPPGAVVSTYAWNLDGHTGAQPSALCGGEASQLSTRLAAGAHSLTLQLTDTSGRVTAVTHQVIVPPAGAARLASARSAHGAALPALTQVFSCSPGPGDHPGDVTGNGGPPAGCAAEVQFGLADAVGCLKPITSSSEWPAAESRLLQHLVGSLSVQNCPFCATASRASPGNFTVANFESGLAARQSPFISYQPVRINGVDFYPHPGAAIVLLPDQNLIFSSNAQMKIAGIPVSDGLLDLYVPKGNGTAGTVHIDQYTLSEQADRLGIGSLPFDGSIGLDFAYHRAQLPVHVTLPNVFSMGDGSPIQASVTLSTDNHQGLKLDEVNISVPDAFLGPMEIEHLTFEYKREGDVWSGGADVVFPDVSIRASPPPPDRGFGLREGHLDHIGAQVEFDPAVDLFPGIALTHIGFTVGLNPTRFSGSVGLSVAEVVDVDGTMLGVFASPGAPYVIPADAGAGLEPVTGRKLSSTSFAVGGEESIVTPAGKIGLGSGYFLYQYPDYAEFGGGFFYGFHDIFSIDGHIKGFVQVSKRTFNVEAALHACVAVLGCTGVEGLVSSSGIAACWSQSVGPFQIDVGLGYHWGASLPDIYLMGCDVGPYRASAAAAGARAAAADRSFTLPPGLPFATLRVRGVADAPTVTLTGPRGEKLVTPAGSNAFADAQFALLRQPQSGTTFIGIRHPSAGTWTVSPQPGSPGILEVANAEGMPAPRIKARVVRAGAKQALLYDITQEPGQRVSFVERGPATWRVLGTATAPRGRLAMTPAPGPTGVRQIVALVEHGGLTSRSLTVASFHVAAPARPGPVGRLQVARNGNRLSLRWGTSSNATRYDIDIALSDGRKLLFLRPAGARTLTVNGVSPSISATVRVTGLMTGNQAGRSSLARLRARSKPTRPRRPALRV
jgi:hypothetical protein